MKAVILAGGLGTRLSEETYLKPKPMVEVGGRPILWHIMKTYYHYGVREFIICCGYRGYKIKEYFSNYALHMSDVTIDSQSGEIEVHNKRGEDWRVSLVDTGETTMTGGRLRRIKQLVEGDEAFCMTYGDGLADIDVSALISFHRSHGKLATVTAVPPPGRFGMLKLDGNQVADFGEKTEGQSELINGGFFVLSPGALNFVPSDAEPWENTPMQELVKRDQLMAFRHHGFWQAMDTLREKQKLEELWKCGAAPWKVWEHE